MIAIAFARFLSLYEVVPEYFKLCEAFWELHKEDTPQLWTEQVKAGKMSDFGANIYF